MSTNITNHPLISVINEILGGAKPSKKNHVIINVYDGTVTSLDGSYVVDLDTVPDYDKNDEWDDETSSAIAYDYGTPVSDLIK